jgi:DNA repair ATPase RecN
MKVKELMERVGINQTGRAVAYIKDGLEEINMLTEVHTNLVKIDITKDKRFYTLSNEMIKMMDIRCKNHLNSKGEYRSIPRMLHKPVVKDADNI